MIYRKTLLFLILFFNYNIIAHDESIFESLKQDEFKEEDFTKCIPSFIAINKITTKSKKITLIEGASAVFDNLTITVKKAFANNKKEAGALISILEQKIDSDPVILFQGWILHPKQYLSTMNHPIYEILMIDCKDI
jgi:hypothetical protein